MNEAIITESLFTCTHGEAATLWAAERKCQRLIALANSNQSLRPEHALP